MANIAEAWVKRAKEVLTNPRGSEAVQFTISFLNAIYGPRSAQLTAYNATLAQVAKSAENPSNAAHHQLVTALGVIRNTVGEIEAGLIVSLRAQVAGEVLSELVSLGKEILADGTESAKNVSAVLISAAFEDLVRRMGSELAGVTGRPALQDLIITLKNSGVLTGGQPGLAQSYLKFRNDSLHADWANVNSAQVQSCIGFIEALLLEHFS